MAKAQLTQAQANYLKLARNMSDEDRSAIRAELFRSVKQTFGIPESHKLKVEIDDANHPHYLTLFRKKTDESYALGADGKWVGASTPQGTVSTPAPVVRWFQVDSADVDDLMDAARQSLTDDWYYGQLDTPDDMRAVYGSAGRLGVDSDGTVWIGLEEADL